MARKVIIGVTAGILLVAMALFAAEKAQKKEFAEKPAGKTEQQAKAGECTEQHEALLDQLISAYKANDREKMGDIIKKMQERREKRREFAKFNRWHQRAHCGRGMDGCCPAGRGGWQMPCGGPPCQRPCWGGGMGACGQPAGERRPMPCWRGGMGAWEPPAGQCRPMRGCKPGAWVPENEQQSQDARPMDDPPEADW